MPKLTITTLASYNSSVRLLTWCWPRLHSLRWWASHGLRFHNHFLLPSQWQDTPAPQSRSRWTPQISELPESLWDIHLRQIWKKITAGCSKVLKSALNNSNDLNFSLLLIQSYPRTSKGVEYSTTIMYWILLWYFYADFGAWQTNVFTMNLIFSLRTWKKTTY